MANRMRPYSLLVVVLGYFAVPLPAQQAGATVEGDVYLVTQGGDVKRGAGNTVRLLPGQGPMHAALAKVCRDYFAAKDRGFDDSTKVLDFITGSLPALARLTHDRIDSILVSFTVAASPTGINAHYRFGRVNPGHYLLWAETQIGDNRYTWWAPIVVRPQAGSVSKDLDNSVVTEEDLSNEFTAAFKSPVQCP